jgi:hypothetical protein
VLLSFPGNLTPTVLWGLLGAFFYERGMPGSLFSSGRRLVSIKPRVSQLFSERTTNMAKENPGSPKACPANCIGGYADKQRSLYSGQKERIPTEILDMAKSVLQYCTYCHAVWEDREGSKKLHGFLENSRFYRHKLISG